MAARLAVAWMVVVVSLGVSGCGAEGPAGPAGVAGPAGSGGSDGLACWDLNGNAHCDPAEDRDDSGGCDAADCQGSAGEPGDDGLPGDPGGQGETGLSCWDLDADRTCDPAEDRDGSGNCDAADCQGGGGGACAGNSAPTVVQVTATAEAGGFAVAVQASDADGDLLRAELAGSGGAITRDSADALLFHFVPSASGTHTLTAIVTDGCFVALGSVAIEVSQVLDYAWRRLGPGPASSGDVAGVAVEKLRFDGTRPYVAFLDKSTVPQGQLTVSSFDGEAWAPVGAKGISGDTVYPLGGLGLAVWEGRPYVAYFLQTGQRLEVKRFDGSGWVDAAPALTPGYVSHLALEIQNGALYLAYLANAENRLYVQRFSGGAWSEVAPALEVPINQPRFGLDVYNGEAYVAYKSAADFDSYCVKSGSGEWAVLGGGAFTDRSTNTLAVRVLAGMVWVASDGAAGNAGMLQSLQFNGWVQEGPNFSVGQAGHVRLDFDQTTPWVGFWDVETGATTVRRLSGAAWESVGADSMSPWAGVPSDFGLADGVPHVAFRDNAAQALMVWSYRP